ncbi:MAG: 2-C-methyl-D-erythritol 4-phosphate cytidylyltransferase, partial [Acetobacteraceae bacterium]|nr:2-C-methyl-D-erythritol 4-phosphate cytidylyltransferase [Acetobacteraceae bacterium]
MRVAAILVAAGSGLRFGADRPKQYSRIAGKPVARWAAERLAPHVALLQPVGDPALLGPALEGLKHLPVVTGGAQRQDSVRAGLEALGAHVPELVLVHDAARPFLPEGTVPALLATLATYEGAIPAVPVADTLKRAVDGSIAQTVSREGLYRAQTPQAFRFSTL